MFYLVLFSAVVSFILGVYLLSRNDVLGKRFWSFVVMGFLWAVILVVGCNFFTGYGVNLAALYHLRYGLSGSGFGEFFWEILLLFVLFVCSVFAPFLFLRRVKERKVSWWQNIVGGLLLLIGVVGVLAVNEVVVDFWKNAWADYEEVQFESVFREPVLDDLSEPGKNIVYIYLESFERTYFDEELFPGLVVELKDVEKQSISFVDISQTPEMGWTIAGMVASQCGLPLLPPSGGNSMEKFGSMFAGATCLGDILKANGYELSYVGGAEKGFAGKGNFYKGHGFDEVMGRDELLSVDEEFLINDWGVYDQFMFEESWRKFEEKSKEGGPFGLFMLTLDTHHPSGLPSPICEDYQYGDGGNTILNAVHCSDVLVSRFIDKVMASEYADETIIVVQSDHKALNNTASGLLNLKGKDRRNLLMIIDPSATGAGEIVKNKGTTLDVGRTVLGFLGYDVDLGLGRDLLSEDSLIASWSTEQLSYYFGQWVGEIRGFWDFPKIDDGVIVDAGNDRVVLGENSIGFPALLTIDESLHSLFQFEADDVFEGERLSEVFVANRKGFSGRNLLMVWVDSCEAVERVFEDDVSGDGDCLVVQSALDEEPLMIEEVASGGYSLKQEVVEEWLRR